MEGEDRGRKKSNHWFISEMLATAGAGPGSELQAGTLFRFLGRVAGTSSLEPPPLPHRVFTGRKLESGSGAGNENRHCAVEPGGFNL